LPSRSPFQLFARRLKPLIVLPALLCVTCRQQNTAPAAATPAAPAAVSRTPIELPSPVIGRPYPGTGTIILINRKEGWIEIKHEEIKGLMPAMTMEFWLKRKSLVDHVSVGDRVDFTIVEETHGEYITEIKKARP